MAEKIQATYRIGSADVVHWVETNLWSKVYDGIAFEGNSITWSGVKPDDTKVFSLTNDYLLHVGSVNPTMDEGYPKITRDGVDVTDEYQFTQITTTFEITARDISLKSADLTKEYDGTALVGGGEITDLTAEEAGKGYVRGEEFSYTFTGSRLFVGSCDNVFTVSDSDTALISDYNSELTFGTLTITKRTIPLTITVNDQTRKYDGTNAIDLDAYTVSGELACGDTVTVTLSNESIDAGTYTGAIKAVYEIRHDNGDGTFTDVTDMYANVTVEAGDLTIEKRDVTITSDSAEKKYDGTALTAQSTSVTAGDGFVEGEGYTAAVTGSRIDAGTSSNTFTYTLNEGTKAGNYNISTADGELTVTKADAVTVTAGSAEKMYDGTALTEDSFTCTGTLAEGDTLSATVEGSVTDAGTAANKVTGYKIINSSGKDVTGNYEDSVLAAGTLTVNKRDVTLTSGSAEKKYDGTALTNSTVTVGGSGWVTGEGASYDVTGSRTAVGTGSNTFSYTLQDNTKAQNYEVSMVEGTLTVTGNDTLITITAGSDEKIYNGTELTCGTYSYEGTLAEGDRFESVTVTGTIVHSGSAANTVTGYRIVNSNGDDVTNCYANIRTVDGTLTVNRRDVTLTSGSAEKKYDGTALTDSTMTVSGYGWASGEGASYDVTGSRTAVGSGSNEFTYSLNAGTLESDYNITTVEGTLTVTANDTLITVTAATDSRKYDGTALTNDGFTCTGTLAAGDTLSATVTGSLVDVGTAVNQVSGFTVVNADGDDVTNCYSNIQTAEGTLSVTKRDVTLTSATDSKPYDGTPLTNDTVEVGGDGWAAGEGATCNVTGSQTLPGSSSNTFTYTLNDGTKDSNYNISTAEGVLTVEQSQLEITIGIDASSGLTYLYDNTNVKVLNDSQYTVTGLADGDRLVNVTITTDDSDADVYNAQRYTLTYDIVNAAGEDVSEHYVITENKNDVTITPRNITLQAGSASKVYDGTALTCDGWSFAEGGDGLLEGETIEGVTFTADSTVTHAADSPVANKIDASGVTITKADGTDSSMNYVVNTLDGALNITARTVLLVSTSAEKYYDGTPLQNRQVIITGLSWLDGEPVTSDGFLAGDGCTYDFKDDNKIVDKDGNILISEDYDTAYGQTEVGTSKNEFTYNNFTSVYYGSYESDYTIIYGGNQEEYGISKDVVDLFGDLTVWGGPVEINMTDYSWTYDYQSKIYGYYDDGYTVIVTENAEGTEETSTEFAHNSEGEAVALLGSDTIVVSVTGEKVQHVINEDGNTYKLNTATYKIYRDGVDVTEEIAPYYDITCTGGVLQITPRVVELVSGSASKVYDGEALTENTVTEGSVGRDKGFVFGEGAAYEVTGSQTEIGCSANTFAVSKLLNGTIASDYTFQMTDGLLVVRGEGTEPVQTVTGDFTGIGGAFQLLSNGQAVLRTAESRTLLNGELEDISQWTIIGSGDFNGSGKDGLLWQNTTGELCMQYCMDSLDEVNNKTNVLGIVAAGYTAKAAGTFTDNGIAGALILTPETGDISVSTSRGLACFAREDDGNMFVGWLGALVDTWDDGVALKGDINDPVSVNQDNYRYEVVAVGDLNGDGRDDLVIQNTMPTVVTQDGVDYAVSGSGDVFTFLTADKDAIKRGDEPTITYAGCVTGEWSILGTGDFDGNGIEDVLLSNGSELVGWNIDNGQRQSDFLFGSLEEGQKFVGIADFNGDGTDDLLIRLNSADDMEAWLIENGQVTGTLAIK